MNPEPTPLQDHGAGFFTWHAYDSSCKTELWATAYVGKKGTILFDPIVWPQTTPVPKSPVYVVKTNENHDRDCQSCLTRFQGQFTQQPPEFQPIFLPGAGENETAFFHIDSATLIVGDALINLPPKPLMPLPDKYCTSPSLLMGNLTALGQLPIARIFFAHGAPILQDAPQHLQKIIS